MKGTLLMVLVGFVLTLVVSAPAHSSPPVPCFTKCKWISQPGGCGPCNICTQGFTGGWTGCDDHQLPCNPPPCDSCCQGGCLFFGNPC